MVERKLIRAKYIISRLGGNRDFPPVILEDHAISVKENLIESISKVDQFSTSDFDEVVDFDHHVLMPGFVNTHSHAGMTLYRGYADDLLLFDWLENYIWPIEAITTPEEIRMGAKLAAIEAIMS